MKRRIALIAIVALMTAPQMFAGGTWLKTVAAAQKAAKEKNQLILVDMFAQWCGWCHRFEREVFPSQVFQQATSDMVLLRLDTEDRGEGSQFQQKYGVTSLPTFLLLTPDLSVAGMIRGYAPPNDFVRSLKDTRQKYSDFQKRLTEESKIANDPMARLALAKELVMRASFEQATPRLKKLMTEKKIPISIRDEAYYQAALSLVMQNKLADAQKTIRDLKALSKLGEAVERAHVLGGEIYLQQGNYLSAANEFRSFKAAFPNSPLLPRVEMMLPNIEKKLNTPGK